MSNTNKDIFARAVSVEQTVIGAAAQLKQTFNTNGLKAQSIGMLQEAWMQKSGTKGALLDSAATQALDYVAADAHSRGSEQAWRAYEGHRTEVNAARGERDVNMAKAAGVVDEAKKTSLTLALIKKASAGFEKPTADNDHAKSPSAQNIIAPPAPSPMGMAA